MIFGRNSSCSVTLTSASRTITRTVSKLSVPTILLAVFEYEDKMAYGGERHGITLSLFWKIPSIWSLMKSLLSRTSAAGMSATGNLNPNSEFSIIM